MDYHDDVLKTIRDSYFHRMQRGECLSREEFSDAYRVSLELSRRLDIKIQETEIRVSQIEEELTSLYKEIDSNWKMVMGFLELHGLEDQFEVYARRIDRKLRKKLQKKSPIDRQED